jgi:hypothetical protein
MFSRFLFLAETILLVAIVPPKPLEAQNRSSFQVGFQVHEPQGSTLSPPHIEQDAKSVRVNLLDTAVAKNKSEYPKGLIGALLGAGLGGGGAYLFYRGQCEQPSCDVPAHVVVTGAITGGLVGFGLELLFRLPH